MPPSSLATSTQVYADRDSLGLASATAIAAALRSAISEKGTARVIFAAAPSQTPTLQVLAAQPGVDWSAVTAFHMDEYLGLEPAHPAGFGNWLRRTFFDLVPLHAVHYLRGGEDPTRAALDYAALLAAEPIDVVCLGIGVNGHLAFNDPPAADFADPLDVKVVALDDACRQQQVDDGGFATFDEVPRTALTLTVPRLLDARSLFCMVLGPTKAPAVRAALEAPLDPAWPCTALRTHPRCSLFLDTGAAALLAPTTTEPS